MAGTSTGAAGSILHSRQNFAFEQFSVALNGKRDEERFAPTVFDELAREQGGSSARHAFVLLDILRWKRESGKLEPLAEVAQG